ncbi:protein NKG7 isoform X1 [Suricata suricatta]|uniref:protein NKG7 isoform X1 n=1 Tax=Suricata suricatta TaxID=37032 RepID=UPI0011555CA1|nr:protein NKG7 isoform X1 [Suricata suricatta]
MELCRSLALCTGCLGLVSILTALSTDFWFVATGPNVSCHSGLWPKELHELVAGYIHVTQSFCILAALCGLLLVIFTALSYVPSLSVPGRVPLASVVTAFTAAIFVTVAMVVYTSERWHQPRRPQVQSFFSWSFYLGWVSLVLFLCAEPPGLAMTPCERENSKMAHRSLKTPSGASAPTPSPPETPSFVPSPIQQRCAGIW